MILVVSLHIQFNRQAPAPPAGGWVPPLCHYPKPKKLEALIFKRFFDKKAHESRAATGRSEVHKLEHVPKNLCRDADCVGMSNFYLHLGVEFYIHHSGVKSSLLQCRTFSVQVLLPQPTSRRVRALRGGLFKQNESNHRR